MAIRNTLKTIFTKSCFESPQPLKKDIQYISLLNDKMASVILSFSDDTDTIDTEEPTYLTESFIADIGGAAGLIFGLNLTETGFNNIQFSKKIIIFKTGFSVLIQSANNLVLFIGCWLTRYFQYFRYTPESDKNSRKSESFRESVLTYV